MLLSCTCSLSALVVIQSLLDCSLPGAKYNQPMPLVRGLILLLAIWLVIALTRALLRSYRRGHSTGDIQQHHIHNTLSYETMVACDHCRIHSPKTEAIHQDGRYFCSTACYQQNASRR